MIISTKLILIGHLTELLFFTLCMLVRPWKGYHLRRDSGHDHSILMYPWKFHCETHQSVNSYDEHLA